MVLSMMVLTAALATPGRAQPPVVVRIAWQPYNAVIFYTASDLKIFERVGLQPQYTRFTAGPPQFAAFQSESVDVGLFGTAGMVVGASQGLDYRNFYIQILSSYADGLVARPDSGITRLADLRGLVLGGLAGQRGLAVIDLLIRPDRRPFAYRGPAEAAAALRAGEVGAVLMDLPAAVALAAEDPGVQVVGRVVTGEQYVLVFPGGSRLRPCVDAVLAELRADGTLRRLAREWLPAYRGIPTLGQDRPW